MRISTQIALFSLGLALGACADEEPGATVDKSIAWQVCELAPSGSCADSLDAHNQAADETKPFQVSCGQSSGLWQFSITDPGRDAAEAVEVMMAPRFKSTLSVRNINPATGACNVEVIEKPDNDASDEFRYLGSCGEGCQINVQPANGGWDFIATLQCDGLYPDGNTTNPPHSLYKLGFNREPIYVAVGNCN